MSFLSKLSELRKTTPPARKLTPTATASKNKSEEFTLLPKNYVRDEDPAVRRLKELRRKEQAINNVISKKPRARKRPSSGPKNKVAKEDGGDIGTVYKKKIGSNTTVSRPQVKKPAPLKKMSFEELMKQAENNATISPTVKSEAKHETSSANRIMKPNFKHSSSKLNPRHKIDARAKIEPGKEKPVRLSLPKNKFAQPNDRIRKELESRKKHKQGYRRNELDEEDSDLSDFIEHSDDDDRYKRRTLTSYDDPGYDRDEIWAMFNRGKKRDPYAYDDYDEGDDMEANEMEILEEEEYARKMAKLEDKREEAWLRRREEEKKRLKGKK
ncbi:hypothetical protein KAFR_0B02460 [Kazachstania africana CBS 2517]|uniref:SPT2 chromatin protein n=1 Tax=Kazachstania africana (strain ATCC 22294 / BCRC 22015 / CBS 2517 / CECT 1963 / NBRC 1671 / NRRL Y-8276) TaxID=1071382 RepID=H2AQ94_KAZAF|nr:hypothetical protein KAFR_0B02460 [Kazachstania africana CBS 2517]CCF56544.1 hypothetical protein KAFR_0B02460 [Kazachstania africana CBS 2517]